VKKTDVNDVIAVVEKVIASYSHRMLHEVEALPSKTAFVDGSIVYLRPLERSDLTERYLGWFNDPEVTRYMEIGTFSSTMEDLEYYQDVSSSRVQVILAVCEEKNDQPVGNTKLGPIHWVHRKATFGILIGDKASWGVEGRLRQDLFQGGEYKDRLWMGILRSEFQPAKSGSRK